MRRRATLGDLSLQSAAAMVEGFAPTFTKRQRKPEIVFDTRDGLVTVIEGPGQVLVAMFEYHSQFFERFDGFRTFLP
jgi:hypothetical protein